MNTNQQVKCFGGSSPSFPTIWGIGQIGKGDQLIIDSLTYYNLNGVPSRRIHGRDFLIFGNIK